MAAKGEGSNESKKRKRFSATDGKGEKLNPKKVKLPSKDQNKGPKKPLKPAKQQPHKAKSQFGKSEANYGEKEVPKTTRERRLQAKV